VLAELRREVPELRKLNASADQSHLTSLLDKIGAKVVEMARGTPNLVSDESVLSKHDGAISRQNFSFLTLHHASKSNSIVVDEFLIDRLSGEKFETDFLEKRRSLRILILLFRICFPWICRPANRCPVRAGLSWATRFPQPIEMNVDGAYCPLVTRV